MLPDSANLAKALAEAMKHHQRNAEAGSEAHEKLTELQDILAQSEQTQTATNGAMAKPVVAQAGPYFVDVVEGQSYKWCACGRSANQPLCDGSHVGNGIEPVSYNAETSRRVLFCGCKATKNNPICDGSHRSL